MDLSKTISLKAALDLIASRGDAALNSCNSHHITCCIQQIRGILWLFLGEDPGSVKDLKAVLDLVDVPYEIKNGMIYWGDDLKQLKLQN